MDDGWRSCRAIWLRMMMRLDVAVMAVPSLAAAHQKYNGDNSSDHCNHSTNYSADVDKSCGSIFNSNDKSGSNKPNMHATSQIIDTLQMATAELHYTIPLEITVRSLPKILYK